MKRKIYLLLFMLTVLANSVRADDTIQVDGINYAVNTAFHRAYVVKGNYSGDIVIPPTVTYNNIICSVEQITERAFKDCIGVTSVTIPYSVWYINPYAFQNCTGLTTVTFPLDNIRTTSLGLSEGIFSGCTNLSSISLPDRCTYIPQNAFYGCSSLSSFTIPSNVTTIGEGAFRGCTSLSSITIPASVTTLYGGNPFKNTGLTEINVAEDNTAFCSVDGVLFNRDTTLLIKYPEKKAGNVYTIPNTVTSVSDFSRSEYLTSIIVPNTVTQFLGTWGFENCPNLTSVHFPDIEDWCNITFVTSSANPLSSAKNLYINNELLQNVTIPDGTSEVKRYIFWGCTSLTSVTIPSTVTLLREGAFGYCTNLTSFYSYATTPPGAYCFNGVDKSKCNLYVPATSYLLYKNADEWKDFALILPISGEWRWVKFLDWNDTILWEGYVEYGTAAVAPSSPTRENYTFTGWDKDFSNITEDMTIKAQYAINRYLVQFFDWDDTLLKEDSVEHGTAAVAPNDPILEGHTFIGWDTEYDSIIHDTYIYAIYEINYYNVKFIDWDSTVLSEQQVAYNYAAAKPSNPQREGYSFIGWDKEFEHVKEDMIITAQYQILQFSVRFSNWDGSLLQSLLVDYGAIPVYTGETPQRDGGDMYIYTFIGWSPEIIPAYHDDMTYYAQYEQKLKVFTVTFLDWDSTIIETQHIEYGSYATIPAEIPTHEGYTFVGWDKEFGYITSDLVVMALYEKDINYYTIIFQNWDGLVLMNITGVAEGTLPIYTAELPTRPEDDEFTYAFIGWTPEIVPATEDAIYTATYEAIEKTKYYNITFLDWDGTLLQYSQVEKGTLPEYTGDTPTCPDDEQYTYTFTSWTPDLVVAIEDATYTATYDATPIGEGIEDIYTDYTIPHKVLKDGQIYIIRGDKTYTITGAEVK